MVNDLVLPVLLIIRTSRVRDEGGQTLAEYSLIISAIAVAAAVTAVIVFRGALAGAFISATDCLSQVTC